MPGSEQTDNLSSAGSRWIPQTETERKSIREELVRILADPLFRNSKRYPMFLEYVVEQTLNGHADSLKERVVGVDVFGRRPDYDTNVDHMVRNVAAEVRKRLTEYYETSPLARLRIEIPAGSYAAQFRITEPEATSEVSLPVEPAKDDESTTVAVPVKRQFWSARRVIAAVFVIAVLVWAGSVAWSLGRRNSLDRFWAPLWAADGPVTFCVGPEGFPVEPGPDVPRLESLADTQRFRSLVSFSEAVTLLRVAVLAKTHGKDYRVLYSRDARVSDLYAGSAVLIGTGDDELIRLMSASLRFHFQHDGSQTHIADARDPKRKDWMVDWLTPYNQLTRDYAIVWRVHQPYSGHYMVGVAGITRIAVAATGELLSSADGLNALERATPGAWKDKNVELVLRVQVDRGSPFPPEVVASHVW